MDDEKAALKWAVMRVRLRQKFQLPFAVLDLAYEEFQQSRSLGTMCGRLAVYMHHQGHSVDDIYTWAKAAASFYYKQRGRDPINAGGTPSTIEAGERIRSHLAGPQWIGIEGEDKK